MERKALASKWVTPYLGEHPYYFTHYEQEHSWETGLKDGDETPNLEVMAVFGVEKTRSGVADNGTHDVLYTGFNLEDIPAGSIINSARAVVTVRIMYDDSYCDENWCIGFYGTNAKCLGEWNIRTEIGDRGTYKKREFDLSGSITAEDLAGFGFRMSSTVTKGVSSMVWCYGGCTLYLDYSPAPTTDGTMSVGSQTVKITLGLDELSAIYAGEMKLY